MKLPQLIAGAVTAAVLATAGVSVAGAVGGSSGPAPAAAPAANAKGRQVPRAGLVLAANTIGITPKELRSELKGGKSIADVATAHHVSPQTIIDALVKAGAAQLPDRVTKFVNAKRGAHAGVRARALGRHALALAAKTIGIKPGDLRRELRAGHTIASVATAHSVSPQTVIDALVKAGDAKIEALKNAGKISGQRAATLEQKLPAKAAAFVNTWLPKHHA